MKAKDALQFVLDKFDPECFEAGAAGCPNKYFAGAKNICNQPGRTGSSGNCLECWDQEVEILQKRTDGPAPELGPVTFTLADLTIAFYNTVSKAVEDYGGNAERLYSYTRGVCDLVDALAQLITGETDEN